MVETLNFREAVQRAGVSRQRLNEAIKSGRLPATRGGGPGRPTTILLEDLQAWCLSEGLAMPVKTGERLERLPGPELAALMQWMEHMASAIHRIEATLERLERSQAHAIRPASPATDHAGPPRDRAGLMAHIRRAKGVEGQSYQQIADALNAAGVPTFSGRGKWQKGTVGKLINTAHNTVEHE